MEIPMLIAQFAQALWKDIRYAVRGFAGAPGFAAVATLTLAVAIASSTTVFSWVDITLLQPVSGLPAGTTYSLETVRIDGGQGFSYPDYVDCSANLKSLAGLAASQEPAMFNIGDEQTPRRVYGELVTNNYLAVLGAQPILGRSFEPREHAEKELVAVISHRLWQGYFHGDPDIIGKTVRVNKNQVTLIGVAPPGFGGAWRGLAFDMWVPLTMGSRLNQASDDILKGRQARGLLTVARLKDGFTYEQARSEAHTLGQTLAKQFPASNMQVDIALLPEGQAHNNVRQLLEQPLTILLAMCGLVLLIACANVANLLLARATSRQKELSLRLALGATRERLMRQMLTETLLLAGAGALIGLPLAYWARRSLAHLVPPVDLPVGLDVPFNAHILGFSILVCVLAAVISGLVPALHAARPDLIESLKEGGRGGSSGAGTHRLRDLLVIGEVALAVVAIAGAGLFAKSFYAASSISPGFDPHNVLVCKLYLSPSGYTAFEQRAQFMQQVKARLEQMPGIAGVSYAESIPLGFHGAPGCGIRVDGYVRPPGESDAIDRDMVAVDHFKLMKIPVLEGREFTEADSRESARVMVVNEEFSRHYLAGRNPVGVTVRACGADQTIVGMVKNTKFYSFVQQPRPAFYMPFQQSYGKVGEYDRGIGVFVRSTGDPKLAAPLLRRVVADIDPAIGAYEVMPFEEFIGASVFPQRVAASLLSVLGGIALLLAAIGLYSVMAYSVTQRTHEIGIRMALGGQRSNVMALVLGKGVRLTLIGLGAGILAGLAVSQMLSGMLLNVSPADPLVFAATAAFLMAVALLASYLPARSATQVDPLTALRIE
jgi:predicted permease